MVGRALDGGRRSRLRVARPGRRAHRPQHARRERLRGDRGDGRRDARRVSCSAARRSRRCRRAHARGPPVPDEGADRGRARPEVLGRRALHDSRYPSSVLAFFSVIHVLLSAALVTLILMHSGREPARRDGLHADLAGRHAHRRAEPDAPDARRGGAVLREHDRAVPPARVAPVAPTGFTTSRACAATRSGPPTSTATSSASRSSRRPSTSTTRTATTSTSATRPARPGRLITFFEWPRADRGRLGRGTFESIGLETPAVTEERELEDPDGLRLRLYPGDEPAPARRRRVRLPGSLRGPVRRGRAARVRASRSRSGADRRRDHAPRRLARGRRRRAERVARAAGRARAAPDAAAGAQVLPLDLLPDARRDPVRDRDRRPGFLVDEPPTRLGQSSRCRPGSSPSARRSSASWRRSPRHVV